MAPPPPDFGEILRLLNEAEVRFLLIGGLAMIAHGSAHLTLDVDITYERTRENCARIAAALSELQPRPRDFPDDRPFRWDTQQVWSQTNCTLRTRLADLDLLAAPTGADSFESLWARALEVEFFGQRLRIAALDDLIVMKRAAGRPKDLLHLIELEALRELASED